MPALIALERVRSAEAATPGLTVPTLAAEQSAPSCKVTTAPDSKSMPPVTVTEKEGVEEEPGLLDGDESAITGTGGGVLSYA